MAKKQTVVEKRWELNLKVAEIYGWKNITRKSGAIYYGINPRYPYSSVVSKIPNYVNNHQNLIDVLQHLSHHWKGEKWNSLIKHFEETFDAEEKSQDLLYVFLRIYNSNAMCKAIVKTHEEWESGEGLGIS